MSRKRKTILVANGVNLDLLGRREPNIYGDQSLKQLEKQVRAEAKRIADENGEATAQLVFYQSNHEGEFLEKLSEREWSGILINPGAWTHTSLALADRLAGLGIPFVEVHISNLAQREDFRQRSYAAPHALGCIHGFGLDSYNLGLRALLASRD